ncbi:hypothetical protein L6452_38816 [Arctium lappa]|uniref:Uncharacterized protein n=1 Tax=Arctium lappa TaxID=4217 RepID=A0ACB8XQT8_ARCLA|nr:hypothetical protein L6452_38816 [Arctium lappa]
MLNSRNAEFALAMCRSELLLLSGGKDKSIILWSIHDHISTLATELGLRKSLGASGDDKRTESTVIQARGVFRGHEDTIEDVHFSPSSAQEFCSVGDDLCLILWYVRIGSSPVVKVEKAHDSDLHCVDWNTLDENLILTENGLSWEQLQTSNIQRDWTMVQGLSIDVSSRKKLDLTAEKLCKHCSWEHIGFSNK